MNDSERHRELSKGRRKLVTRLLVRLADHYKSKTNETIRERGFPDFNDAHTRVLFNLELDGNRITTLAERARISVQAMGKLVRDLEEKGYVERRPDPTDGRAQIITLTEKGTDFFDTGIAAIAEHDVEMNGLLGDEAFDRLQESLRRLVAEVDPIGF